MRKDGDIFKIGVSVVLVDQDGDITIKEKEFRGFYGLWEQLIRKRLNKEHVTSDDLRTYNKILLMTNTHLVAYQPRGVINVPGVKTFREIIAPLRESQRPGFRIGVTPRMEKLLKCPLVNYIAFLPNNWPRRPWKS